MMKNVKQNDVEVIDCQDLPEQQQVKSKKQNARPQQIQINSLSAYKHLQIHHQSEKNSKTIQQEISKDNKDITISELINEPSMDRSEIVFNTNFKSKKISKNQQDDQKYVQFQEEDSSPQKLTRKDKNGHGHKISLLGPPQNMHQQAYTQLDNEYSSLTKNHFTFSTLHSFLHEPLTSLQDTNYIRYIFEIHSYNFQFTFHSYYEFYIRNSEGEMINIMRAQKESLTVSSAYQVYAVNPNDLKSKQFTAKLKYNTLKSEYNLYDIDQKVHQKQPRNILATALYDKAFGQSRQIQMFRPKDQYRIKGQFVKSPMVKNLSQLYDEQQTPLSRKIQKLKTVEIQKVNQESVRQEFQLKKQGRKILLHNEEGLQKFYMGKKQDGRYIILAGSGLTPLEIFMLAIVNLQH